MKKVLFLLAASVFCLSCGGSAVTTATNTNQSNANKPAAPNTAAPTNTAKPANTAEQSSPAAPAKTDGASNPELDFTLVNKTGYDIKEVFVGASGTGNWTNEDEVLKGRTFANGNSLDLKFSPKATAEYWDVKVTWADGSGSEEWLKLKLTEIEKATLVYDRAKDETSALIE